MKIITGFECSRIIEKKGKKVIDVLDTTKHCEKYKEDLLLLKSVGIDTLRVAVPWHKIEKEEGYDWEWMDGYMETLRELNINPIMDPLHHTSFPTWLKGGFMNSNFGLYYSKFFLVLVNRYSWVRDWTIINEPFVTLLFCTNGIWYPFKNSKKDFKRVSEIVADTITYLAKFLRSQGKRHVFIDACESHQAVDQESLLYAYKKNQERFTLLDKLTQKGCPIDILGLDYYAHSEFEWSKEGRQHNANPIGFAQVALQYYERYKIPMILGETNIRGFITDRQTWFVYMYKECLKLSAIAPLEGICWYPFIDSTDWDSLITKANGNIDPQGIIWLDEEKNRNESEFSDCITKLIRGEITIDDFPTYEYRPPLDYHLSGFLNIGS